MHQSDSPQWLDRKRHVARRQVDGLQLPGDGVDDAFLGLGADADDHTLTDPRRLDQFEVVGGAFRAADPDPLAHG